MFSLPVSTLFLSSPRARSCHLSSRRSISRDIQLPTHLVSPSKTRQYLFAPPLHPLPFNPSRSFLSSLHPILHHVDPPLPASAFSSHPTTEALRPILHHIDPPLPTPASASSSHPPTEALHLRTLFTKALSHPPPASTRKNLQARSYGHTDTPPYPHLHSSHSNPLR